MQQFFSNQPRPKKSRDNFHSNSRHITIMMLKNVLQEGRIVQRIAFLLCTQRPPVWFSALPRIFLLMLLRLIECTAVCFCMCVCVCLNLCTCECVHECLFVVLVHLCWSLFDFVPVHFTVFLFFNIWLTNKSFSYLAHPPHFAPPLHFDALSAIKQSIVTAGFILGFKSHWKIKDRIEKNFYRVLKLIFCCLKGSVHLPWGQYYRINI